MPYKHTHPTSNGTINNNYHCQQLSQQHHPWQINHTHCPQCPFQPFPTFLSKILHVVSSFQNSTLYNSATTHAQSFLHPHPSYIFFLYAIFMQAHPQSNKSPHHYFIITIISSNHVCNNLQARTIAKTTITNIPITMIIIIVTINMTTLSCNHTNMTCGII